MLLNNILKKEHGFISGSSPIISRREMEPLPPRDTFMVINKEHDLDDNNKKGINSLYQTRALWSYS